MSRHRLYYHDSKYVRDTLRAAQAKATLLHETEKEFIELLYEIDCDRFFVRYGYKSLRTFLVHGLKFTRTQAQRIVTQARRNRTTSDIEHLGTDTSKERKVAPYFRDKY
jgi:hypothetical protein